MSYFEFLFGIIIDVVDYFLPRKTPWRPMLRNRDLR